MRRLPPLLTLALIACRQDIGLSESSKCDGLQQRGEDYVDAPFDRDGDGFFDAAIPDCQEVYDAANLDCDDTRAEVNPVASEVLCNGLDDDCADTTPDDLDADLDGYTACNDCDDNNANVNPAVLEVGCNGLNDDCSDETVDSRDRDGDGFTECEDCDDTRNYVSPNEVEVFCNGLDDDCNEGTPDAEDRDLDTFSCADDCDDGDPDRAFGLEEVCDDSIDNDCDADIDEDCRGDYSGDYYLDNAVNYACAFNSVELNFTYVEIVDLYPNIYANPPSGRNNQPGNMSGTFTTASDFSTNRTVTGGCTESYTLAGTFTTADTFTATFSATYTASGPGGCFDCRSQSWVVTGTRQ